MQFDDPLVAGATLVRTAIQSADYVAGVSGWKIARNGDVEFNNGDFRGDVIVTASDGTRVTILANNGSRISFRPPTNIYDPLRDQEGYITSNAIANMGVALNAYLQLASPVVNDASFAPAIVTLLSAPTDGLVYSGMQYSRQLTEIESDLRVKFGDLKVDNDIIAVGPNNGVLGRGIELVASLSSNSTAIGNSEAMVLDTITKSFKAGRAYKLSIIGTYLNSAASQSPNFRFRKGSGLAGGTIGLGVRTAGSTIAGSSTMLEQGCFIRVGVSDISTPITMTASASASFTVTVLAGTHVIVTDVGPATMFPDATLLV